jgi:hypothetical protein
MERELTAAEKAEFFRKFVHVGPSGVIEERNKREGFVAALPAPSLAVILARVDALIVRTRRLEKLGY